MQSKRLHGPYLTPHTLEGGNYKPPGVMYGTMQVVAELIDARVFFMLAALNHEAPAAAA